MMRSSCALFNVAPYPFVLGVCGSIASGKSSRCKHIVDHLAPSSRSHHGPPSEHHPTFPAVLSINGDKVGHRVYVPGTPTYRSLIDTFGKGIIEYTDSEIAALTTTSTHIHEQTGEPLINRKRLGAAVFGKKDKLQQLNDIVWPAISASVQEGIRQFGEGPVSGVPEDSLACGGDVTVERRGGSTTTETPTSQPRPLVVLEAALLQEVGLHTLCNEVWVVGCSVEEAIRRVMNRDGLSEEDAAKRVASQPTAAQRLSKLEASIKDVHMGGSSLRWTRMIDTTHDDSPDAGNKRLEAAFNDLVLKHLV